MADFLPFVPFPGDFLAYFCPPRPPPNSTEPYHCWSAAQYAHAVATMRTSILEKTGKVVDEVLFTTDEKDPEFLRELTIDWGWKMVDEAMSLTIRREWGDW